jgi:hypothetical protein
LISGVLVAFLVFDGAIKMVPTAPVTETLTALGYSGDPMLARSLGAILLTGLLGEAIATHLRVGSAVFSHMLFGGYLGLMAWGGLYLRSEAARRMIPSRLCGAGCDICGLARQNR